MNQSSSRLYTFGDFGLDSGSGLLIHRGRPVPLTPKVFDTLLLLVENSGRVVEKDEFVKKLWQDTFVGDDALARNIYLLRKVLEETANGQEYIATVPKRGYRFVAQVKELTQESLPTAERTASPSPALEAPAMQNAWRRAIAVAIAALLALTAVGFLLRRWTLRRSSFRIQSMQITRLTDSGKAENVAISPDGRYVVYAQREAQGVGLRLRQLATGGDVQILTADALLFEGLTFSPDGNYIYFVRPANNDPGFKYLYIMPALGGPAGLLVKDIDSPVSFSSDGRQFVYTRGIPTHNAVEVRIANTDGSGNRTRATIADTCACFQPGATWSPDGRTIAVPLMRFHKQPRFMLYMVSVADGTVRELRSSPYEIGRALWSPEGDSLMSVLNDRESRGQLWTVSNPQGDTRRLTNDLSDYDFRTDLTRDANTLAAISGNVVSNIWIVLGGDTSKAEQITSLNLPLSSVTEDSNGELLANGNGKLWTFSSDGKQRGQFTDLDQVGAPTVCGRFVVMTSNRSRAAEIIRIDADGSNATKLASGDLARPLCSPDGKYVFYLEAGPPQRICRISVGGGTPVEIAKVLGEDMVGRMSISPDGKALAYPFEEFTTLKVKLAIIPADGGPPIQTLDAPGGVYSSGSPLWSPGGKSVEYILAQNGASNIWEQSLDGSQPRQLTRFNSGRIFDFSWSPDGKRLLLCRGEVSSDVVLLSNLRLNSR